VCPVSVTLRYSYSIEKEGFAGSLGVYCCNKQSWAQPRGYSLAEGAVRKSEPDALERSLRKVDI
jgi:hypothetical protein